MNCQLHLQLKIDDGLACDVIIYVIGVDEKKLTSSVLTFPIISADDSEGDEQDSLVDVQGTVELREREEQSQGKTRLLQLVVMIHGGRRSTTFLTN